MTNKEVLLQIIAEASGKPVSDLKNMAFTGLPLLEKACEMGVELSDEESEKLLNQLRGQLPGIRRWLHEGGLIEAIDRASGKSRTN